MKIRLMGTADETLAAVTALADSGRFTLLEVSDQYPNRGNSALMRVYIEAQLAEVGHPAAGPRWWVAMSVRISGQQMTSDATRHTARQVRPGVWSVSWLPERRLDRNQANTAMVLAEAVAETVATNELHCGHRLWPNIDQWAAELGLTGPDAVVRASEPPRSTR